MRPIALVALLPLAALAQPATPETAAPTPAPAAVAAPAPAPAVAAPPAAAPRPPSWSIGAGVGFDTATYLSTVSLFGGLYLPPPQVPTAGASLERALSPGTWLVLGVNGSYLHEREDLPPGRAGMEKGDLWTVAVSAGVRRVLTPAGAPVDVSATVLAEAGATGWKGDVTYYDYVAGRVVPATFDQSGVRVGASAGLAIDRELARGLSLRLATPLVGASYTWRETKVSGQPTLDGEDLGASVRLAPRLELRLAF